MKTNIGLTDRVIRLALAVLCGFLAYEPIFTGTKDVVLVALAAILLYTGITGYCRLYRMFSIQTSKTPD